MYNPARFSQEEQRNRARSIHNASYLVILRIIDNIQADQLLEADLLDMLDEFEQVALRMDAIQEEADMDDTIYTLVPSINRGRYACDDPETGHDVTSGEPAALLLGGHWIEGHIEHSRGYDGPGCYHIADWGKQGKRHQPAHAVAASLQQPHDLYCGYYFIATDGCICGLCTGMKIRLRKVKRLPEGKEFYPMNTCKTPKKLTHLPASEGASFDGTSSTMPTIPLSHSTREGGDWQPKGGDHATASLS